MKEFFQSMDPTQQFFWYVALGASVIFIVQTIMTFFGMDSDGGMDGDVETDLEVGHHPFQLFSLRNLVNFFLGFGWTGVALFSSIDNKMLLTLIAVAVGIILIVIFFLLMRSIMKLAEDNSFKIEDAIGKTGDVYITIPANNSGKGKVSISVKGTAHELDAITTDTENLKTGSLIRVINVDNTILVVTALN